MYADDDELNDVLIAEENDCVYLLERDTDEEESTKRLKLIL